MTELELKIHLWHNRIFPRLTIVGECWEYRGRINNYGYGLVSFRLDGRKKGTSAHRIALEVYCGELLGPLQACHHCDNPPCCNPAHLFSGTNQVNVADSVAKGRHKNTPRRVIVPTKIEAAIRSAYRPGKRGTRKLAIQFNIGRAVVKRIIGAK